MGFSFHIMFLSDHNNTTLEVKLMLLYVTSFWLGKLFFQVRNLYSCVKVAEDFVSPEVSDLQFDNNLQVFFTNQTARNIQVVLLIGI